MSTDPAPFHDAADRLLDRWWQHEQLLHAALQGGTCSAQRETLGNAAKLLKVQRQLKRACDVGGGLPPSSRSIGASPP
jgi:hypothetical protein